MGQVVCTTAFGQGGLQVAVGTILDDTHYAAVAFPTHFSAVTLSKVTATAGTTPGTCVKKIEVFNSAGTSLGFVPVYDAIT